MLKLQISAIGTLKAKSPEAQMIEEYQRNLKVLASKLGFSPLDIFDYSLKKDVPDSLRKSKEAELLMQNASPQEKLILCDERGKMPTSEEFASLLQAYQGQGIPKCHFIIGGADGLCPELLQKADMKISFGKCVWPHLLVRVMLCEQIYRAMTILSGHPYHRA